MQKKLFLLVLSGLFTALAFAQINKTYPVFTVNDTFSQAQPKESTITPKNYELHNTNGFILDCTNYDFSLIRSMNDGKNPDAIFIVSKAGNYLIALNINGQTIADKTTMQSLDNPKKKFAGFKKGDTPLLGIGTLKIKDGQESMTTYWIAMVDVK